MNKKIKLESRELNNKEKILVTLAKFLAWITTKSQYEYIRREIPIPFTGGKRLEAAIDNGQLRSLTFCQAIGEGLSMGEKCIITEPCAGIWGLPHQLDYLDEIDYLNHDKTNSVAFILVKETKEEKNKEVGDISLGENNPKEIQTASHLQQIKENTPEVNYINEEKTQTLNNNSFQEKFKTYSHHEIDNHINKNLLGKPTTKAHAQEFLAAAKQLCLIHDKSGNWNHSVCHFIEGYKNKGSQSLLNYLNPEYPEYQEALNILVEKSFANEGSINRILLPILRYNLDKAHETAENNKFATFPPAFELLTNQLLANAWFKKSDWFDYRSIALMIRSKNPTDLWEKAEKEGIGIYGNIEDYKKSLVPKERLAKYLETIYGDQLTKKTRGITSEALVQNMQINAEGPIKKGIFVDVDDTLIIKDQINKNLVNALNNAKAAGIKVQIISGGDPNTQKERLQNLNLPKSLGDVAPKESLKGHILEYLVDDTSPTLNGFAAKQWLDPTSSACIDTLDKITGKKTEIVFGIAN